VLKRPSTRRRSHQAEVQLNLVPMMDALVTMIAFLMYTMAFLQLTMIESPLPMVSNEQNLQQLKERPLQLTVTVNDKDVLLWSPFELIQQQTIANREDGTVDTLKLHEALIAIKQKFPTEDKIILVPKKETSYDTIVLILDASKALDKTDPVIVVKNPKTGVEEQAKNLFTEVVFGNLLGDE
jgi:biopolymer transport protein ExbD